ncbi:Anaerobic dimethyl sulfoxide reductase chain B [Symmachiella dynata]|uniref:Anaerobic dimethyl sulfoxide reductase chain B n=1 Tax=Symmachiella dynata TaxID=2527995 RepID=A0A517ZQS4_9PLAN|nr:DmsC/YnfH family molybdoenzyme membrane anchor subunit [Symmachiella dynata]QDU44817.1 Anaerobic dimethyl sulfoxide reductase chain B [Symmachiella dynata]
MDTLHKKNGNPTSVADGGTDSSLPILGVPPDGPTLIERLLNDQQQMTAVEQFSRAHDLGGLPAQSRYYSKLVPTSAPGPGQQYAFEVDLDRCSGCKACVTACHTLNGLDEEEAWRDVGLLVGGTAANPMMQHVTTACHHCLEPACMSACPVDAYEKDPETGIVKHLDDQCFGCQYCTLACPYDVPKYHSGKGIVRKCDMCSDRLADGEAPACVQACPHEAIAITVVDVQQVIEDSEADNFLPAAPEPHITLPTTRYKTSRVYPRNMLPADYYATNPQHPHWPLIVMLVLTQLSVGAFVVGSVLETRLDANDMIAFRQLHAASALGFGLLALTASTFHLGRPQYAFRAIVGLKHSWLSREIVAFGVFAGAACVYAAAAWIPGIPDAVVVSLSWGVAAIGVVAVFCSVMIYVFTKREFWSFTQTVTKFYLTSAILGIAATWLSILLLGAVFNNPAAQQLSRDVGDTLLQALIVTSGCKFVFELSMLSHLAARRVSPLKRSAQLLVGPLSNQTFARFALGVLGGVVMPVFLMSQQRTSEVATIIIVVMLFVACLAGELLERYQYFAAVSAPRMPGGLRS